jgi:hypothetical protein
MPPPRSVGPPYSCAEAGVSPAVEGRTFMLDMLPAGLACTREIVDAPCGCWIVTSRFPHVYSPTTIAWGGQPPRPAHRVVWQLLVGPIPDGLVLDHLCEHPRCVLPTHLEPVTAVENSARFCARRNRQELRERARLAAIRKAEGRA